MAKISGGVRKPGKRGRTRAKFKKTSAKVTVNKEVEEFKNGEKVQIVIDSSYHSGLPDKGFHGLTGYVSGKRGLAYEVELKKGKKDMMVVTTPAHLKRLK
ncbi:MAG: 50S ribosomal protein L21e [Candidatus Diapherotrites archaeon]|nr:50S ribosomal protein L21e [Candidatus Diapherotrites archaeon]